MTEEEFIFIAARAFEDCARFSSAFHALRQMQASKDAEHLKPAMRNAQGEAFISAQSFLKRITALRAGWGNGYNAKLAELFPPGEYPDFWSGRKVIPAFNNKELERLKVVREGR